MLEKIKKYVREHKEMQKNIVSVKDMEQCAKSCNCSLYQVMYFLRYCK